LANPAYMAPNTWAYKCENQNTARPEEQTNAAIVGMTQPGELYSVNCPPPIAFAVLSASPKVWRIVATPPQGYTGGPDACGTYPKWRQSASNPGVPCTTVKPPQT
jgi:hypothetical protein